MRIFRTNRRLARDCAPRRWRVRSAGLSLAVHGSMCGISVMARGENRPVTVHSIAEHVGVSPSAVSTVLANRHEERRLAPATVERIRQAVRELGYVPNVAARRLRAHDPEVRHMELGILTTFEAPLFLISRAMRELQRSVDTRRGPGRRFSVSIAMYHAGRLREMPGLLSAHRFNGVIITNTLPDDDAFLRSTTLPYAVVVQGRRLPNYCCVLETPGEGGRRAAEILLARGCRDLLVLTPSLLTETTADRANAFCAAVREKSGREAARVAARDFMPASGAAACRAHLKTHPRCDGLFVVTDTLALGAYHALKEMGRSVPEDVAVVGVGDHEHADYFDPPLTCVGPMYHRVVEEIVALLFSLMHRRRVRPGEIFVRPEIARRASA
jgi:LacI family transcriptional regulator